MDFDHAVCLYPRASRAALVLELAASVRCGACSPIPRQTWGPSRPAEGNLSCRSSTAERRTPAENSPALLRDNTRLQWNHDTRWLLTCRQNRPVLLTAVAQLIGLSQQTHGTALTETRLALQRPAWGGTEVREGDGLTSSQTWEILV